MQKVIKVSVIIMMVIFTLFVLQNVVATDINLLFWSIQLPLAILLFISWIIGVVSGIWLYRRWQSRQRNH